MKRLEQLIQLERLINVGIVVSEKHRDDAKDRNDNEHYSYFLGEIAAYVRVLKVVKDIIKGV